MQKKNYTLVRAFDKSNHPHIQNMNGYRENEGQGAFFNLTDFPQIIFIIYFSFKRLCIITHIQCIIVYTVYGIYYTC